MPGAEERRRRIMVVDDDRDHLQVVAAVLGDEYDLLALTQGSGLAARAEAFSPDLLILDVNLTDATGLELCRDLKGRRATSRIPVVFLSGLTQTDDFLGGFAAGGTVYLTKPVEPEELRRTVRAVLAGEG